MDLLVTNISIGMDNDVDRQYLFGFEVHFQLSYAQVKY